MHYKLLTVLFFLFLQQQIHAQVTKQFDDKNGRTNIVKESNASDLQILEENFSDADVGKVVRIGIEQPKKDKPEKEPTTKPTPPVVERPQRKAVSSSNSSSSSQTSRKRKRKRYKLKKRRKTPRRKKWSCYHF